MKNFYRDFKNKKEKEEYLLISSLLWGGSPLDIDWAMDTKVYINAKEKYYNLEEKNFNNLAIALGKIKGDDLLSE
jgi:hypothetical protein